MGPMELMLNIAVWCGVLFLLWPFVLIAVIAYDNRKGGNNR